MKRNHWYLLIFLLMPALAGLVAAPNAAAATSPLVTTEWLQKNLGKPGVVIIDVRTEANYAFAHLPGAVSYPYIGWEPVYAKRQCQLMPTEKQFAKKMQELGVNKSSHVIIYDQGNTASDATKGGASVWIMETMGHKDVSYLDGGFTKWTFEGRIVDNKKPSPKPGNFKAKLDSSKLATMQDVTGDLKTKKWILLDNRNAFQFFGTTKRADATRYGHIPGAISFPADFMYNAGANKAPATLKSKSELKAMAKGVGLPSDKNTKIITYCNSGQQSGAAYFVLRNVLGYKHVKCYDGSILEYSAAEELPMVKYTWGQEGR
jgi:thiosulfate/3-mercaptopyruvate sulfurtransferase